MAIKFGRAHYTDTTFVEQTFHKNQEITSASEGTYGFLMKKDDYHDKDTGGMSTLTPSGSNWAFVHGMFYLSGSTKISQSNPAEIEKFNSIYHNFNQHNDLKPHHNNKFHDTGSVFYIPQAYYGERIQPGTFQLTARTGSYTNTTKEIIIKDDGNGNLYSSNCSFSQSGATSISSSDNYIGNVFYDLGVAVLTETSSWSGSINYTDVGGWETATGTLERDYRFWSIKFNSTTPIFTSQYSVTIKAGDFNTITNYTARGEVSGSDTSGLGNLANQLTGSEFSPYFTQIHFYRNQTEEPIITANLPRPIKMRDDIDLIITFRLDH